ncbi:piggyBac transposable element-derived protein 3-like [Photinus pyralis]|uniref:piggyBac transposable element-derived protein 3-like n=1 Tax=Photinus pyralis TaxID=7054 RepID=UPI0012675C16|nr:piggyBac transposable element-derived protein 3-like [Photinus pyralis]XP_031335804.1 piggyBac transposable element-derived protein 3-like [Photinus pyralis]
MAVTNRTPYELFSLFFDDDVVNSIVTYSNIYSAQKNRHTEITISEIKKFFGILLLSGYNHVSRRRMYWETVSDTHNKLVSSALSRDRFEFILSHLHCCDNNILDKKDKYAKVRPLFNQLNDKFLEFVPHSENHSVDESMVPYFGRHSCKQFIKGKPIRYGYKFWVGSTDKGYMTWFEPYQGANSVISDNYKHFGLGPSVVLTYADVLLSSGVFPYHIFFDNFFTTVPLLDLLSEKGIRGTGTVRENRMSKCPLETKTMVKKRKRGYFEYKSTEDHRIVVTTWNDNNIVNMASNAEKVIPPKKVQRYSQKEKKKISIDQPALFSVYNAHMGGVDRGDQNISLYRREVHLSEFGQ